MLGVRVQKLVNLASIEFAPYVTKLDRCAKERTVHLERENKHRFSHSFLRKKGSKMKRLIKEEIKEMDEVFVPIYEARNVVYESNICKVFMCIRKTEECKECALSDLDEDQD